MPEPPMLESKYQIDWSKDGSSNLADLHWSGLPEEETEITVCSFSCDSNGIKKLNDAYEKLIRYEQNIIEEQKEINKTLIALQDFHDEEIKALLSEHRQLLSRIERLPEA